MPLKWSFLRIVTDSPSAPPVEQSAGRCDRSGGCAFHRADHDGVSDCSHAAPLPVLEFHGASDHVIRYRGTDRSQPVHTAFDAPDRGWVDRRVDRDGCDHTWPGALSRSGPGAVDRQFWATDTMLQFFDVTRLGPLTKACDRTTGNDNAAS